MAKGGEREEWELATGFAELREASRGRGGEDNSHTLAGAYCSVLSAVLLRWRYAVGYWEGHPRLRHKTVQGQVDLACPCS